MIIVSDVSFDDFYHPNEEGEIDWNDPEIGIVCPQTNGEYKDSASAKRYSLDDGAELKLSDKDQK